MNSRIENGRRQSDARAATVVMDLKKSNLVEALRHGYWKSTPVGREEARKIAQAE